MKIKYIKTCVLVIILAVFSSCNNDDNGTDLSVDYYPFTAADTENLLVDVPEVSDVLTYTNQQGEELSFQVSRSINGPTRSSTLINFAFRAGENTFRYDVQTIEMDFLGSPDPSKVFTFAIGKTPDNELKGIIEFVLWNAIDDSTISSTETIVLDFDASTTQLSFNGMVYENVITIYSQNEASIGTYFGVERNMHTIYYDKNYGIVGFDDTFGNEWRIEN